MLFELRALIPSVAVVEEVSIAGSMSDSMEESGDGGMMMLVACATFGRRRMMERRHNDADVTSGAITLRLLLSVFLT